MLKITYWMVLVKKVKKVEKVKKLPSLCGVK